jgi:hypothetical protein
VLKVRVKLYSVIYKLYMLYLRILLLWIRGWGINIFRLLYPSCRSISPKEVKFRNKPMEYWDRLWGPVWGKVCGSTRIIRNYRIYYKYKVWVWNKLVVVISAALYACCKVCLAVSTPITNKQHWSFNPSSPI